VYNQELSSVEDYVFAVVAEEFVRAQSHGSFHSGHEGYAVILEELQELWFEVTNNKVAGAKQRQFREAVQVAATAIKYITSLATYEQIDLLEETGCPR
jgi:hypothetical protein